VSRLVIAEGTRQGEALELAEGHTTLGGNAPDPLELGGEALGSAEAEFVVAGDVVLLRNLGPGEDVLVNGLPIRVAEIHTGDCVCIGETLFHFESRPLQPVLGPTAQLTDDMGTDTEIIDKRAVLAGLGVSLLLLLIAFIWKLTPQTDTLRKLEEFEFSVAEPALEEFELEDPIRDILKERPEEMPDAVEELETPDVRISTNPAEFVVEQPVVESTNVDVETPEIEVAAIEVDIQDAPLEIEETSEDVTYALVPIAADTAGLADLFEYEEPIPSDKPRLYTMNTAPQPGSPVSMLPQAFGDQDVPTLGRLGPANINLFGTSDFMRTMERSGGAKAKAAVDSALHWLALHQEPDGLWDSSNHEGDRQTSLACTGLSLLALMGGGHTTRKGEYRRNTLKGLEAIIRNQDDEGRLAFEGANLYTHAICTIALCEAYGRARDPRVGAAAQKAIRFCEQAVNPDGGWRYQPNSGPSDMSVTAWFIQALKTARLANLDFDNAVFSQGQAFLDSCTDQGASKGSNGVVSYQFALDQRYGGNSHPALTSAGMMIRQFSGMGVRNHILVKGADLTRATPPRWNNKDFYYWYYATYAMHNMGGEHRIWWNQRVREVLLENQSREGDHAGSWDPTSDHWAKSAGRAYTTALGALCLEVYYRYSEALNSFGTAPELDDLFFE